MKFSYNWLQSYFEKKLPKPEELAKLLTMHFAEVEELKKEGKDYILNIDVRPNRAGDCFSHNGIAREIATILDLKLNLPETGKDFKILESKELKTKDLIEVSVVNKNACKRYVARIVSGVKVASSPEWIQERLISCGLRPINNIVDVANYVMLETGQPLHAFDEGKIRDRKIIVRFAKKEEKITTLDDGKYDLDSDILVIADSKDAIAIAGVKGGKIPEIDKKTRIIVLESANFDHQIIRRTSKKLNLRTDASLRFEHGLDPNLAEFAVNRAANLIQEIAGGEISKGVADIYPKKVFPKNIKLDLNYAGSLLGIEIPKNKIENILKRLGFEIKGGSKNSKVLNVKVPTQRLDVSLQEDLIEEIGRIYGYGKIIPKFPTSILIPPKRNLNIFWENMAKDILKGAGFIETYNYSFISEEDKNVFNIHDLIEIENPLSSDFSYLRNSLIPNLLKDIQKNKNFPERVRIFELGKVFAQKDGKPEEKRMLTVAISGDEFLLIKGLADVLFEKLGIGIVFYDSYKTASEDVKISVWQPQKTAEIRIGNKKIGFLGEISRKISDDYKIPAVTVLDINFELLSELCSEDYEYRPISRFPVATRDIAVLVPRKVSVKEVLNKIEKEGEGLIKDVNLFDIFEGASLPGGKKNLAFHIIFQAKDRTLSTKEIDELQNKIIKNLEKTPDWQVRK